MGMEQGDGSAAGRPVDWNAFALDLAVYEAEKGVESLVAGGARIAESLGLRFSPESFVLGALFRELTQAPDDQLRARIEAVQRLARHAAAVAPGDA